MTRNAQPGEQTADLQRLFSDTVKSTNAKDVKILDSQATLKRELLIGMRT